ncbi:MAG: endo alpha-1,4 polygalactosaminidase [bacterium]|nr:endo alpha-1,4 polygalactosaminidase [bacterium]
MPPANGSLDYQLGGAYDPPAGVTVLSRDRKASPYAGIYNICYVNGYQTQPDEEQWWIDNHYDLLLKDSGGEPFIDPDWDEILLDITTQSKRDALAAIVGGWIQQCADDGFDAVEIDNLDTYSRSDGLITQDNAVQFMSLLSATAHGAEIAIAQKNSTEIADRQAEMGTDFVVAEECNRWSECDDYKAVYGDLVFVIEYRQQDFDAGCSGYPELSIVLRDLNLVTPGNGSYVYDGC